MKIRKCKSICKNCIGSKCVDLIPFRLFYKWEGYSGFAYDFITDDEIITAFSYISYCDIEKEWQDDITLYETKMVPDSIKHAIRIAALVEAIRDGKGIDPVAFDTYAHLSPSCIYDGNHRIRALQYLKFDFFPANLSGLVTELNKFRRKYYRQQIKIVI